MAIVVPGKRPSPRVQKSKVLGKKMQKGRKATDATLNLTSMVDMFMMITIFLLMVFDANGQILFMSKDIHLPEAVHGVLLQRAPVVAVSPDAVTLDGRQIVDVADLQKDDAVWDIPSLEEALRDEKRKYERDHASDADHPFTGMINIQADKKILFKVIKRVMYSCNQSGYGNINFAALVVGKGAAATAAPATN